MVKTYTNDAKNGKICTTKWRKTKLLNFGGVQKIGKNIVKGAHFLGKKVCSVRK